MLTSNILGARRNALDVDQGILETCWIGFYLLLYGTLLVAGDVAAASHLAAEDRAHCFLRLASATPFAPLALSREHTRNKVLRDHRK